MVADVASTAGEALIRSAPIFGPLLLLCVASLGWALKLLLASYEARILMADTSRAQLEASNEKDRAQQTEQNKLLTAQGAIIAELSRELRENTGQTTKLVEATNTVIRDAVRGRLKSVDSSDQIPAQQHRRIT